MKASQKDFKAQAAKAARTAQVFYFCGPDEAGAHDAAHTVAALLPDPGERIELTGAEFDLLVCLCDHAGRVIARERLIELSRMRLGDSSDRSIDVLVSRLRQKIERDPRSPEIIRTIRSGGYLFTPEVTRS